MAKALHRDGPHIGRAETPERKAGHDSRPPKDAPRAVGRPLSRKIPIRQTGPEFTRTGASSVFQTSLNTGEVNLSAASNSVVVKIACA
jgi:hypothetical protein